MKRIFGRDRGLTLRILATSGLLGLLYLALRSSLINLLKRRPRAMLVIVLGLAAVQYWTSDKLALAAAGAKVVSPEEAPEVHAIVERLCAMAGLLKPRIALVDTDVPNAFATGRSPKHAAVAVTTGLLRRLDPRSRGQCSLTSSRTSPTAMS